MTNEAKIEALQTVEQQFGIYFSINQWHEFERKFDDACKELKLKSFGDAIQLLINKNFTEYQLDIVAEHLTIGETYFFRDKEMFQIFNTEMLEPLLKSRANTNKFINIWSAGCCTGEEAYTIAMFLRETIADIENWKIRILASDINPLFLEKARIGKYTQWSLRDTPEWAMNKYFTKDGIHFHLKKEILKMVEFQKVNLITETAFPSNNIVAKSFDMILCRNVLMYFSSKTIENISTRFGMCLNDDGWFITSPVEVPNEGLDKFTKVKLQNQVFFSTKPSVEIPKPSFITFPKKVSIPKESVSNSKKDFSDKKSSISNIKTNEKTTENVNYIAEAAKFFKLRKYDDTITLIEKHLKLRHNDIEAQEMLVHAFANDGQLSTAIEKCIQFLKNNNHARLFHLLATLEVEMGNLTDAEAHLRQALYIDHKYLMAHFMMSNILRKQGNTKAADKYKENLSNLLKEFDPEYKLTDFDGIAAGKLLEMITK